MKSWIRHLVIAPKAPRYTKHGYSGCGYVGVVISETDTHATVNFEKTGWLTFHKSRLSLLKPESKP